MITFLRKRILLALLVLLALVLLPVAAADAAVPPGSNVTRNRMPTTDPATNRGTVNAKGTVLPYTPDRAVDDDLSSSSYWYTTGDLKTLTVLLPEACFVSRFTLTGLNKGNPSLYPRAFSLFTSMDSGSWIKVSGHDFNDQLTCDLTFPTRKARYIRLVITQGNQKNNDFAAVKEFAVFTTPVNLGSQVGQLAVGTAQSVTFPVTTTGFADGSVTPQFYWFSDADGFIPTAPPAWATPSVSGVTSNRATVTMQVADTAPGGTYYFCVGLNGNYSNPTPLTIQNTVTFKSEGNPDIVKYVSTGGTLTDIPAVPAKVGFTGDWDTTDFTNITQNKVVNAVYTPITHTVTYKADGITIGTPFTVNYGSSFTTPPAVPAKTGFNGAWETVDLTNITSDKVVNAVYTQITYTVTYKADGNTVGSPFTVNYGATFTGTPPTVPAKTGFTAAWETVDLTNILGNKVVNAVYTQITHTVTYKADGITVGTPFTVNYGSSFTTPPAVPAKTGFTGAWETVDLTNITADKVVNAVYTQITYTVTYKADGATVGSPFTVNYGADFAGTPPTVPAKTGFTAAWETVGLTNILGNKVVNAVYTQITHTVTYKADGVSVGTPFTVNYGADFAGTPPTVPAKTGFTAAWETVDLTDITADKVVNAIYTQITFTVTYKADGATVGSPFTVNYGADFAGTPPTVPAKTGFTAAWETVDLTDITSDKVVNAIYTQITYTVTYKADGATIGTPFTVHYGASFTGTPPTVPAKTGFTAAWETVDLTDITSDKIVNALYSPNTYVITFDYQGAIGNSVLTKTVTYGSAVGTLPVPTKADSNFGGWYTEANGGVQVSEGTLYTVGSDSVLYAKWTAIPSGGGKTPPPPPASTTILPVTVSTVTGAETSSSTNISATIDTATGAVSTVIDSDLAADLLEKALSAKAAREKAVAHIEFAPIEGATSVSVELPRDEFKEMAAAKAALQLDTGIGTMTLGSTEMASIARSSAQGSVSLGISVVDKETLSEKTQAKVGNLPVYDFSISVGDTQISKVSGSIKITLPYTPAPGEKKKTVTTYYLDSKGVLRSVKGTYNAKTGTVSFSLSRV